VCGGWEPQSWGWEYSQCLRKLCEGLTRGSYPRVRIDANCIHCLLKTISVES